MGTEKKQTVKITALPGHIRFKSLLNSLRSLIFNAGENL